MKTPCIAACKNEGGICLGCHRTVEEIATWRMMTDEQRESVMDRLRGKTSSHQCPQCGKPASCDLSEGKATCWCFSLERRDTSSLQSNDSCLCRSCLTNLPIA
ncbi:MULTISPECIES: cysteine-rich CWC family protein [Vibrio]|nr:MULTISPECIES: cysteine-rich CWC family protein [Vibrio]